MANAGRVVSKKTTGKRSSRKKPAASAKKAAGKTSSAQLAADNATLQKNDPGYRHRMIAETSYYIAERHGFINNSPVDDWLEAEVLVDRLLESGEADHGTSVLSSE